MACLLSNRVHFLSVGGNQRDEVYPFLGVIFEWEVGRFVGRGILCPQNGWVVINSSDGPGECVYSSLVDVIPG